METASKALQRARSCTFVYGSLSLSDLAGIKATGAEDLARIRGTPAGLGCSPILLSAMARWRSCGSVHSPLRTTWRCGKQRELLTCGGWFSFILCIDDMFLLHDRYIGQTFLYVVYVLFAALIATRYRRQLMASQGELFLLAVALLSASIGIDQFQPSEVNQPLAYKTYQLLEEGAKFLGIATWVLYWWHASALSLKSARSSIES